MNIIVISGLIIIALVSGIIIINQIKNYKKQESFVTMVFSTGISLVFTSSSDCIDKMLVGVGVVTKYENAIELGGDFNWAYFILGCILIFIGIIMFCFNKRKLYVLNINAYTSKRLENYISKLKTDNSDFREREIDFIQIYKRIFSKELDETSYECIKSEIEEKVTSFRSETANIKRGYTGIAPIPFVMYAGTFLDRVKIDNFYEFDKIESNNYYVLSLKKNKKFPELKLKTNITELDRSKNKVLLVISLTKEIENNVLNQFKLDFNIVRLSIDNPKDNAIRTVRQLENYTNFIFEKIEDIKCEIPNVELSIVYSGQSCLALEIGKRCFDSTRIPKIICYHYEYQNTIKYPWGIIMNGSEKGKLIKA